MFSYFRITNIKEKNKTKKNPTVLRIETVIPAVITAKMSLPTQLCFIKPFCSPNTLSLLTAVKLLSHCPTNARDNTAPYKYLQ